MDETNAVDAAPVTQWPGDSASSMADGLLRALGDGVIGVDRGGMVRYVNDAAQRLTGCEAGVAIGLPIEKVFCLRGDVARNLTRSRIGQILDAGVPFGPITNQRLLNQAGEEARIDLTFTPVDHDLAMLLFHEASSVHPTRRRLLYQVSHDPLTGLPNRTAMQQTLAQLHSETAARDGVYSILLADLDRFKLVNDGFGHAAGDALLRHFAGRVASGMRDQDSLGRWGGEEFVCLLPDTTIAQAVDVAERLRQKLAAAPFAIEERLLYATISIGVASYPQDGEDVGEILRTADAALFEAKRQGRNRVQSSEQISGNIFSIASEVSQAIAEDRLVPAYQPIVNLADGEVMAEESLARIVKPDGSVVDAARFIDAASQLQMVHRIDHRLIMRTIDRCGVQFGSGARPLAHFVNVSADLLRHPELIQSILDLAKARCSDCGLDEDMEKPLVIEITERELLENVKEAREILAPFLDFGLRLAVDDFGSGFSSLQYLADLPVAFLKIEGEFVHRAPDDARVRAILRGVQDMADALGVTTIAEYVENERILDVVRDIGVHWGQGYYFGKPQVD
ncbi:MAG: EAL domain-containing protein [Gammaproteobacteria bacterium]